MRALDDDYPIIERTHDANKVALACLCYGCSIEKAATRVLDNPERFLKSWRASLKQMEVERDKLARN